MSTTYW